MEKEKEVTTVRDPDTGMLTFIVKPKLSIDEVVAVSDNMEGEYYTSITGYRFDTGRHSHIEPKLFYTTTKDSIVFEQVTAVLVKEEWSR